MTHQLDPGQPLQRRCLQTRHRTLLWLVLAMLGCAAIGFYGISQEPSWLIHRLSYRTIFRPISWVLFVMSPPMFLWLLALYIAQPRVLILSQTHLEVVGLLRQRSYPWRELSAFTCVAFVGVHKTVAVDDIASNVSPTWGMRQNVKRYGHNMRLPEIETMDAQQFCDLLNRYRAQAI